MNTLDEIIRELPSYPNNRNEDNQVIIFDTKNDEILERKPWVTLKRHRFYEINKEKVVFNVDGPELSLKYSDSNNPFTINITYDAQIAERSIYKLLRFISRSSTPIEAINNALKECVAAYVFKHDDFVIEFNKHKPEVIRLIREQSLKYGFDIRPYVNHAGTNQLPPIEFVDCQHSVIAKTSDAQTVEIRHDLMLTLTDAIKFSLSGIKDIKSWARAKLDQYTNNAIVEISYADVLINLDQAIIKNMMEQASSKMGYQLKQLISVPGQDNEKFYFETADNNLTGHREYTTKDQRFKVAINIIVNGRLDLHHIKTKKYIKPGYDIIASMKKDVIEYAMLYLNEKTPEECFLHLFKLENNLSGHIKKQLNLNYGFKDLGITIKFLESDLSKRFSLLQEKPCEVEIVGDFGERRYLLWFRVVGVFADGWFRFRANNYSTTEDEMKDIARMVKNGLNSLFTNATAVNGKNIVLEFKKIQNRVREEFGLEIKIHDFTESLSNEEIKLAEIRKIELDEMGKQQGHILMSETDELTTLLEKKRMLLEVGDDEEEVKKIDNAILAIKNKSSFSKDKFLGQRTNNDFLIPPIDSPNDTSEHVKKDTPIE